MNCFAELSKKHGRHLETLKWTERSSRPTHNSTTWTNSAVKKKLYAKLSVSPQKTLRSLGVLNNGGFTRSYKCSREAALITHWSTTPPLVLVVVCIQMISFHSLMLLTFLNETSTEHLSQSPVALNWTGHQRNWNWIVRLAKIDYKLQLSEPLFLKMLNCSFKPSFPSINNEFNSTTKSVIQLKPAGKSF